MGKRKKSSRKPMGPKKKEPLATSFKCVFCNNETSVNIKIDRKAGVGVLMCKSCGQNFQVGVNSALMHPVDVYAEWIDACESKAQETRARDGPAIASRPRPQPVGARAGLEPGENLTQEDNNFIDDEEEDAEAEFEDEE